MHSKLRAGVTERRRPAGLLKNRAGKYQTGLLAVNRPPEAPLDHTNNPKGSFQVAPG